MSMSNEQLKYLNELAVAFGFEEDYFTEFYNNSEDFRKSVDGVLKEPFESEEKGEKYEC